MNEIIVERFLTADLDRPMKTLTSKDVLMVGDRRAHRYHVRIERDGEPVNDPGSVTAYFVRSDGTAVLMEGTVEDGNTAVVLLEPECYALAGWARLIVRVTKGDSVLAVLDMQIAITKGEGGEIVDPGEVLPSLEELLAKIADMERATADAERISGPILDEVAELRSDYAQQIELLKAVRDALKGGDVPGAIGLLDAFLLDKNSIA